MKSWKKIVSTVGITLAAIIAWLPMESAASAAEEIVASVTAPHAGAGERQPTVHPWDAENPVRPLPKPPLGVDHRFADLDEPPTPERVRLGRWLFFDKRLSGDDTVSCATCHRPENAFSELTPNSSGIHGQHGARKAPSFVNEAWTIYPNFFWDGRAKSLEEQALGPIANPIEMGNTHDAMVASLGRIQGYAPYFKEAFGTPQITKERVAKAIADYERTRMSGNSAWDRWQRRRDDKAVNAQVKKGHELFFFGKAACNQCHLGPNFTDSQFHNLGVGYDAARVTFKDDGRYAISKEDADHGAFKTPTLRDVAKHAPYMHDGSEKTLRDVVEFYNRGGNKNPHLDAKIKPLNLTTEEVDALVAFLESLNGEGYQDTAPATFPQ
jgi:cytochrome c peroxidase